MSQDRLFPVAPDAIALTMRWEWPHGWQLMCATHVSGQGGTQTKTDRYERLSADELLSTVDVFLSGALNSVSG